MSTQMRGCDAGDWRLGDESAFTPRMIASLRGVRSIAAGHFTSLAVDSAGAVFGWGKEEVLGLQLTDTQLADASIRRPRRLDSLTVQA